MRVLVGGLVVAAAWLVWLGPARAQSPEAVGAAKVLFDEALRLKSEGKLAEACDRFAASVKAAPRAASLLNLGDCSEKLGRSASAWNAFTRAATQARLEGRDEAEAEARRRAEALWPRLARMTVKPAPGVRVDGLQVSLDGEALAATLLGTAVPVDPGEHEIAARAPGLRPWSTRVTVEEGDARQVEVPALESEPGAGKPEPGVVEPEPGPELRPEPELTPGPEPMPGPTPPPASPGRTRRIAGLAVGGAGVVAIGVGAVFGLQAFSSWGEVKDGCDLVGDTYECDAAGRDSRDAAASAATISNTAFGVGVAALAAGAVLYLTAPRAAAERPQVTVAPARGGGLLTVTGGF